MDIESVFITGANRGIGLEFVRYFVNIPNPPRFIFATYRNRSNTEALKKLRNDTKTSNILLINMDVTNLTQVQAAKKITEDMVGDKGLNLLINNAGVLNPLGFPNLTDENLLLHLKTNTVGPVIVFQEFLPLLQKSANRPNVSTGLSASRAAVLNISSVAGSIGMVMKHALDNYPCHSYMISKAAFNMAMRRISGDLKRANSGILVVMMCPGWVKTEMGGENAELELPDSISSMIKTLSTLNESHHGTFIDRNGENIEF